MLKAQLAAAQYGGARTQRRRAARSRLCATTASSAPPGLRILVTGSTKGLGRALVDAFLSSSEGVRVCVNSRSQAAVAETVSQLQAKHGQARVCGFAADVALPAAVDALAQYAVSELGGVDCWINNAGSNGYTYARIVDAPAATLVDIVKTNLLGSLLCTRAACLLMAAQPGGGCVFNMEGAGSDGSPTVKYAAYGATKAALPQLARTLQKEMSDVPVTVTNISPGMVQTELISAGKDAFGAGGRFFVNALSEPPEHAAAIIVPQVLAQAAVPRTAGASGKRIEVLSPLVAAQKLARRVLLGENKGRWYAE